MDLGGVLADTSCNALSFKARYTEGSGFYKWHTDGSWAFVPDRVGARSSEDLMALGLDCWVGTFGYKEVPSGGGQ